MWLSACGGHGGGGSTPPAPPAPLTERWRLDTGSGLAMAVLVDARNPAYLYVAEKSAGLGVYLDSASSTNPPMAVGRLDVTLLGDQHVMHLAQSGDRLLLALGDLFTDAPAGLAVVDVSTPETPAVEALWVSATPLHGSSQIFVDGNDAYLAAMNAGIFVFDLSVPGSIQEVATLVPDVDFPTPNPPPTQVPNARGTTVVGDTLYVAYDAGGLRTFDVVDPAHPVALGRFINPALAGKPGAYNAVAVQNGLAYVSVDYCGLEIVDVRDPSAPSLVGWWNPWACETSANTWFNSSGHTNQLFLDRTRLEVLLASGDSELLIVDVSQPNQPRLTRSFGGLGDGEGAWGLGVTSTAVYLGYIRALVPFLGTWSGVRAVRR
jgi:hypothetical protein